ncbi:MAG: phosphoglycerate kinase [Candidatus Undinarchaeales archaeon]|jgi:phosphoglycerate kinase|nr:phosphoglycerate kinase [Candidatus Undinarchaeales archaeon]
MNGMKTMDDFDFSGKTALVRVDINCPIDPETNEFLDVRRMKIHSKTIKELSQKGAKVVVMSHQGRPGSEYDFTNMEKHAGELSKHVGVDIKYIPDVIGPTAQSAIKLMSNGEVILLDNVRFLSEELLKRPSDVQANTHFVKSLTPLADYFVSDAFATAHRSQPSLVGFCETLPSCAGRVMQEEVEVMAKVLESNKKPAIYVAGGAKVKSSLRVIKTFLETGVMDKILTSGLVASVFLSAKGYDVPGKDYVENYDDHIKTAKELLAEYSSQIELPVDLALDKQGKRFEVSLSEMPLPYKVADIGNGTIGRYKYIIENAGTIIANGPAGVFEEPQFEKGTMEIVKSIAEADAFSVVGGGHIAIAITKAGLEDKITHISTGGGACITHLAGIKLWALAALEKAAEKQGAPEHRGAEGDSQ